MNENAARTKSLLVVCQTVDYKDANLGFFHRWLEEFAKQFDLFVIANKVGEVHLDPKVRMVSLGKETRTRKWIRLIQYQWHLLRVLPKVDAVLFHMNPEYVLAAGLLSRLSGTKTFLWYTHKHVSWRLRVAEKIVDHILTASKMSFRLPSEKVIVTGHGIDLDLFRSGKLRDASSSLSIITAGRISPTKNLELLIEAAHILDLQGVSINIRIAGEPILPSDHEYKQKLFKLIENYKLIEKIRFTGPIPYADMPVFYNSGDIFVNLSGTGSLDKAVLEAGACGISIITSNEAFHSILPETSITSSNAVELVRKISDLGSTKLHNGFQQYIKEHHSLSNLAHNLWQKI